MGFCEDHKKCNKKACGCRIPNEYEEISSCFTYTVYIYSYVYIYICMCVYIYIEGKDDIILESGGSSYFNASVRSRLSKAPKP